MLYDLNRCGDGNRQYWDDESVRNVRKAIYKDIKQKDKMLRDHNLYMGHISAFQDLLEYPYVSAETSKIAQENATRSILDKI